MSSIRRTSSERPARTGRVLHSIAFLAAGALLVLGTSAPTSAAVPVPTPPPANPTGPNTVTIPYLGELPIKPAETWAFADCGAILAATPLAVDCAPDQVTFRATSYDPAFGVLRVPIALSQGARTLTIDYLISLEPPEKPEFTELDYDYPFPSGSRVLIPISDLQVVCGLCAQTGGVRIQAVSIKPKRAGTATVTPTHVVLAASSGYTGSAEVRLRVFDDIGQRSSTTSVTVHLYAAGSDPLSAWHVYLPFAADPAAATEVDLAALFGRESGNAEEGDAVVLGCGAPAVGTVLCQPSGAASYHPRAGEPPASDQFSFHVSSTDGEQITGSVTLLRDAAQADAAPADDPAALTPAPAVGEASAVTIVPARQPPAETGESGAGLITPFARLLDRVGA